jgi:predicted dehydrogenase
VKAYGTILYPERVTRSGRPFQVSTPDFVVAMVELADGTVIRLTADFYVGHHSKQVGIEFHGDAGSLYLSNWHDFDGQVEFAEFGQPYQPVSWVKSPYRGPRGVEWGRAVRDMARAIKADRPHRATGAQAAHVVEILEAISQSLENHQVVAVKSDFIPPAPMEWAI